MDGLLDLLSLEGIYPSLSPGMGVPIERRVKSVLRGGLVTRPSPVEGAGHQDVVLLGEICDALCVIMKDEGMGLSSSLQERNLVDLIAGMGELAYAPLRKGENASKRHEIAFQALLDKYVNLFFKQFTIARSNKMKIGFALRLCKSLISSSTPARVLFPSMTLLLQPATPDWFRSRISTYLSLLLLRPEGVRHAINFIAGLSPLGSEDPSGSSIGQPHPTVGPSIPLEVLTQISRLLSSVPASLSAESYLSALAPQLLQLLGDNNPDIRRAAAYTIGNGILGRRKYGARGTIGWTVFAEPILETFNPIKPEKVSATLPIKDSGKRGTSSVIVSEDTLGRVLERLASLVLLHPNPGLTKRLITPCVLSLWNLLCYSREINRSNWADKIQQVLFTYFKTSVGIEQLISLCDGLLWDGESSWTYGPGPSGGIEIRQRSDESLRKLNMIEMIQNIDNRVDEFQKLLRLGVADDVEIGTLFVHVNNHWLIGSETLDRKRTLLASDDANKDPLRSLVNAKLAQNLLEDFKDKLAANPRGIMELVNQLLAAYIMDHEEAKARRARASIPSLAGLGAIVNPDLESKGKPNTADRSQEEEDSMEMISVALSLLSAILSSPEFSLDPETFSLLTSLHSKISHFSTLPNPLPIPVATVATTTLGLLDLHIFLPTTHPNPATPTPQDPHISDRKSHHQALSYLSDPLPPIRAQGLSLLTTLIKNSSPILPIPSTTILLQSLLQDQDEFIYLSAIRTLSLLAARHPNPVIALLLEQYVDPDESASLDTRIRTGEALLKTVENLGTTAFASDVAASVTDTCLAVAGRRARKPKSRAAQPKAARDAAAKQKEADEAWGGQAPSSSFTTATAHHESEAEDEDEAEALLHSWALPPGAEDDIRIRTSALSVLGVAIETNMRALGMSRVRDALDLVLHVLVLEGSGPERAILRRAAVRLIESVLVALEEEAPPRGGWVMEGGGWWEMEGGEEGGLGFGNVGPVLRGVLLGGERDEVVLGHVRAVIARLERWCGGAGMRNGGGGGGRGTGIGNGILGGGGGVGLGVGGGAGVGILGLAVDPERGAGRVVGIEEVG